MIGFDEARKPAGEAPVRLDFSENVMSRAGIEDHAILRFDQRNLEPSLSAEGAEDILRALVALQEQHNVYAAGTRMLHHGKISQDGFSFLAASQAKDLPDWNRFWTQTDTGSSVGAVHFQGGDILQRTLTNPQSLTPQDFRLREDSAGYGAGTGGQDLGADIEFVGPGAAYEKWKGTPQYEQWLKDTGQPERRAAAKPETGAFVLLGGAGVVERKFDTLAAAVQATSDGDTIEVRGNGPFLSEPIRIQRTALTIRAGEGFRPVIKLSPEALQQDVALLFSNAALVLEGLELHRSSNENPYLRVRAAVNVYQAPLLAANCRFRAPVLSDHSPVCSLRNCEFLSVAAPYWGHHGPGARVRFENCVQRGAFGQVGIGLFYDDPAELQDIALQIQRCTFLNGAPWWIPYRGPLPEASQPMRLRVTQCIFDCSNAVALSIRNKADALEPAEAEAMLLRRLQWQGERNLFAGGSPSVLWQTDSKAQPPHGPRSLEDWKRFWSGAETDSQKGTPQFQGGNLRARGDDSIDQLTPEDFRLREGSPGYKAGKDGKDLGAEVALVGPGEAYKRWKQTPEYREWLKEAGQLKELAQSRPEPGAFVLLGGAGVTEQEFATLAEAVQRASAGDTIEIRGNGPFVTPGVTIGQRLVIRAGPDHTPTLTLSRAAADKNIPLITTSASLVLEGLELRRTGGADGEFEGRYPILVRAWNKELSVSNCRFLLNTSFREWNGVIESRSPVCTVRNCQFIGTQSTAALAWNCPPGGRVKMENCVSGAGDLMLLNRWGSDAKDVSIQVRQNTTVGACLVLGIDQARMPSGERPIRVDFSANVTNCAGPDHRAVLRFDQVNLEPLLSTQGAEELLRALVALHEQHNIYAAGTRMLHHGQIGKSGFSHLAASQGKDLADWKRFWTQTDTGSTEGVICFQGGDLFQRTLTNPQKLTPDDFRLRADSAGYRAGPDGKDLGADVELVGPGAAYERWKWTAEYQEWLKDSGQPRDRAATRPN